MKKIILLIVVFGLLGFVLYKMFSSPISRSVAMREALQKSEIVVVYEGLPHQELESDLLELEKKRKDVIPIGGFLFYDPAVVVSEDISVQLKKLLVDENSYRKYNGLKKCGGFHPDYAIRWKRKKHNYWLLICYGCREVVFTNGVKEIKYDLDPSVIDDLKPLLRKFESKRPKPKSL